MITPEELAWQMAVQYGRTFLGDRYLYEEWLTFHDLPSHGDAIEQFEQMHAVALEELRMDNQ